MTLFGKNKRLSGTLDDLLRQIEELETELTRIKKIGTIKANVSSEYVAGLRQRQVSLQRTYNDIVKKHPKLGKFQPLVMDTFRDINLPRREYSILDPVEVDCAKRVRKSSIIDCDIKVDENDKYEIYCISSALIRKSKQTGETVFFGNESVALWYETDKETGKSIISKNEVPACIYKDWFYWYGSSGSPWKKSVFRRKLDGTKYEQVDCLSKEKVTKVVNGFFREMNDEEVRNMYIKSDSLILEVLKKSNDKRFLLILTDINGIISIKTEM